MEAIYRMIVPTDYELEFAIKYIDSKVCTDKNGTEGAEFGYFKGTTRLFELALSNETYPLIFSLRMDASWVFAI
uniref:Uncharacterized protein n=1 Tax=Panagrolaimus superbus TaxID=310955 RepID=A0A914YKJ6_9BILA